MCLGSICFVSLGCCSNGKVVEGVACRCILLWPWIYFVHTLLFLMPSMRYVRLCPPSQTVWEYPTALIALSQWHWRITGGLSKLYYSHQVRYDNFNYQNLPISSLFIWSGIKFKVLVRMEWGRSGWDLGWLVHKFDIETNWLKLSGTSRMVTLAFRWTTTHHIWCMIRHFHRLFWPRI